MEYTDPVLGRLREALERYRITQAVNGRTRSWKQVAFDIYEPPLDMSDEDVDALLKPEAESLRRFAAGKQTPTPERLDRLSGFLIAEECVHEDDLTANDPAVADARGLYRFFDCRGDELSFPKFLFAGTRSGPEAMEIRVLQVWRQDGFAKVAETIHWVPTPPRLNDLRNIMDYLDKNSTGKFSHEGWIVETPASQVLIFFKDPLKRSVTFSSVVYDGRSGLPDFPDDTMWMIDHVDFSNPEGYQEHFPDTAGPGVNATTVAVQRWTVAQLRRYAPRLTWAS